MSNVSSRPAALSAASVRLPYKEAVASNVSWACRTSPGPQQRPTSPPWACFPPTLSVSFPSVASSMHLQRNSQSRTCGRHTQAAGDAGPACFCRGAGGHSPAAPPLPAATAAARSCSAGTHQVSGQACGMAAHVQQREAVVELVQPGVHLQAEVCAAACENHELHDHANKPN